MRKLLIQPQARVDLLEIWHYIACDSVEIANRVGEKIDATILGLLDMPGKGHMCWTCGTSATDSGPYSYVIAYKYDETTLTVVRVVHGRRNVRRLFRR